MDLAFLGYYAFLTENVRLVLFLFFLKKNHFKNDLESPLFFLRGKQNKKEKL